MIFHRTITFYRMMQAGYISANTYYALSPKKHFFELSYEECFSYPVEMKYELLKLFEEKSIVESLLCIEELDKRISSQPLRIMTLIDSYINKYNNYIVKNQITLVGKTTFISEYLFCTDELFKNAYFVDKNNYEALSSFREDFKSYLKKILINGQIEFKEKGFNPFDKIANINNKNEEIEGKYQINSGKGFMPRDICEIEDDALSPSNVIYKRYLLFLYSLDAEDFIIFESYLKNILSKLPIRVNNSIKSLGYRSFYINYLFADDNKLLKIRNFGKKSINDINKYRQKLISFVVSKYPEEGVHYVEEQINKENEKIAQDELSLKEKMDDVLYNILIIKYEQLLSDLSVRAKNGIINYQDDFIEDFINKNGDIKLLRNIGEKTEIEIQKFVAEIKILVQSYLKKQLTKEEKVWLSYVSMYGNLIDKESEIYFKSNGHMPMLHLLEKFITYNKERNKDFLILASTQPFYTNIKALSKKDAAKKFNMTEERIRQICVEQYKILMYDNKSLFFNLFVSHKDEWLYIKELLSQRVIWKGEEILYVIMDEPCTLSSDVLLLTFSRIFSDDYSIIGKKPLLMTRNKFNYTYLVNKQIVNTFNFDIIPELLQKYLESSSDNTLMTVQEMLVLIFDPAWKEYNYELTEDIENIISLLLVNEIGLIPDDEFKFELKGLFKEDPSDVIYSVLKSENTICTIDYLYQIISEKFPGRYKSSKGLYPIINKDARMYRTEDNVALIEWEHVLLGNVRELIVSFLQQFEEPQKLSDIVSFVNKHRKTSERSIRSTMSSGKQFVSFWGGLYGLTDKIYSDDYISDTEDYYLRRIKEMESFIISNKHFPYSLTESKEEKNLYQMWKRLIKMKNLTATVIEAINNINKKYATYPKRKKEEEWFDMCSKYLNFVKTNNRAPKKFIQSEQGLYSWFKKASSNFERMKLSREQETAFLKLCESL